MPEKKKTGAAEALITVLLSLAAVYQLIMLFAGRRGTLLWLVGTALIVLFRMKKNNGFPAALGFFVLALAALFRFLGDLGDGNCWFIREYIGGSFSPVCAMPPLLLCAGFIGAALIAAVKYTGLLYDPENRAETLWFLPGLLIAAAFVLSLLIAFVSHIMGRGIWVGEARVFNIATVLYAAAMLLFGTPEKAKTEKTHTEKPIDGKPRFTGIAVLLILSVLTLGIYFYIWLYRTTAGLAAYETKHPRRAVNELLLCLFVPFYLWYWFYKTAQLTDAAAPDAKPGLSVLCPVMSILLPYISAVLIQDRINDNLI